MRLGKLKKRNAKVRKCFTLGLMMALSACSAAPANSGSLEAHADIISECYVIGEYSNFLFKAKPRQEFVADKTYAKQLKKGTRYWENYIQLLPEKLREDRLAFYRRKYPTTQGISSVLTAASTACSNGEFWKVWPNADVLFEDPPEKTEAAERVIRALIALDALKPAKP